MICVDSKGDRGNSTNILSALKIGLYNDLTLIIQTSYGKKPRIRLGTFDIDLNKDSQFFVGNSDDNFRILGVATWQRHELTLRPND